MSFWLKTYWLFLAVVAIGTWVLPIRFRKGWLLVASFICYATWSVPYLALLVATAALNHFGAKWIMRGERERRGKIIIAGNVALLAVVKYLAWVLGSVASATSWLGLHANIPIPHWALPLGISFYTFESISYILDLMRKRETIHSFWDFQLFIAFFPKLLAGPILRAKEFLPQIEKPSAFDFHNIRIAMRSILGGLCMKLILADSIGEIVDQRFNRPVTELTSLDVWLMGLFFTVNVYLDFAGYTQMAIGSSKLLGIDLVQNFDNPFISTSIAEFWRRWHMSLSRWIRDYLFYPMAQAGSTDGSSRAKLVKRLRLMWAAFLSMVIFGIWHGAGWIYVLYGVYYGAFLAAYHVITYQERAGRPKARPGIADSIRKWTVALGGWLVTTSIVIIGFVIFRCQTHTQAFALIGRALRPFTYPGRTTPDFMVLRGVGAFLAVLVVQAVARWREARKSRPLFASLHPGMLAVIEGLGMGVLLVFALFYLTGADATFVYFKF